MILQLRSAAALPNRRWGAQLLGSAALAGVVSQLSLRLTPHMGRTGAGGLFHLPFFSGGNRMI